MVLEQWPSDVSTNLWNCLRSWKYHLTTKVVRWSPETTHAFAKVTNQGSASGFRSSLFILRLLTKVLNTVKNPHSLQANVSFLVTRGSITITEFTTRVLYTGLACGYGELNSLSKNYGIQGRRTGLPLHNHLLVKQFFTIINTGSLEINRTWNFIQLEAIAQYTEFLSQNSSLLSSFSLFTHLRDYIYIHQYVSFRFPCEDSYGKSTA